MFVMVIQGSRLMEALSSSTRNFQRGPRYCHPSAKEVREIQENFMRGFNGPGWHFTIYYLVYIPLAKT